MVPIETQVRYEKFTPPPENSYRDRVPGYIFRMESMDEKILTYDEAYQWINQTRSSGKPHLLLGNGFSIAYDHTRFTYSALLDRARNRKTLSTLADAFFTELETFDFELVIQQLSDLARSLEILGDQALNTRIKEIRDEVDNLKELLARTLASLHPNRPKDISDAAFRRIRRFTDGYNRIYTANYDLLLYWSLMHDDGVNSKTVRDDGFRNTDSEAEFVVWNHLSSHRKQSLYYLHGALHLFRDPRNGEIRKLTWIRPKERLIDQIRRQLNDDRFPLIVAEGTSSDKLSSIQSSAFLGRSLRSLASIGGGLLSYGLSFSDNDSHIIDAIVESNVGKIAASIYGSPDSSENQRIVKTVNRMSSDRHLLKKNTPLEIKFFDASTVQLW